MKMEAVPMYEEAVRQGVTFEEFLAGAVANRELWQALAARARVPEDILERAVDDRGACRGWWGPRPAVLQAWFEAVGRQLPPEERYRELRRWYARDRGAAIAREIVDLVVCATWPAAEICRGVRRPCAEHKAA